MNEEEYKSYICCIVNRLIEEKLVYPKIKSYSKSNKIKIKILIAPTEWYHELDDDTKYNVEYNLRQIYTPIIMKTLKEFKDNNKNNNLEENNNIEASSSNHLAKCFKVE